MSGLNRLFSTLADITTPVVNAVQTLTTAPNDRRRWSSQERTYLELKGMHLVGAEAAAADLTRQLGDLDGVHGVEINHVFGRAVVERDPDLVGDVELARTIAEFEREHGLAEESPAPASAHHPANADALLREVGALGTSLLGLGYVAVGTLLPVRAVSPLVPAVVSLVDSVPWLRTATESKLGQSTANTTLALGGAATQALTRNPLAIFTDMCGRFCTSRETIARNRAWRRWDETADPVMHRVACLEPVHARPAALPDGPVERVANLSGGLALAGYATVLTATRNSQRALAALHAGTPKPAKAGREAFAAQLATTLSGRGTLLFDREALRRLDRIDTVVLDSSILLSGRRIVDSVTPSDSEADCAELFQRASELVDPRRPRTRKKRGDWSCAPLKDSLELPDHLQRAHNAATDQGGTVVALHHGNALVALVTVIDQLDPLAESIIDAAKTVGEVAVAASDARLDQRLPVDLVLPGGNRLARSVRGLQGDGRVVAVISSRAHSAMTAADLGIGVTESNRALPWGADLICPYETDVHTLLLASGNARTASKYAAAISAAGSCLSAISGSLGTATGAPTRASAPMHVATLFALATGTWIGMQAGAKSAPVPRERTPWHSMPTSAVLGTLATTEAGLSDSAAMQRQPPPDARPEHTGLFASTVEGLITPMTPVLLTGAIISAGLGSVIDAVLITGVLLASALIDGVQRVATDHELARLLDSSQLPARLRRGGQTHHVPADQLVPGDIVELHAGDGVPADCRLFEADGLEVDESSLTGESHLVDKTAEATTASVIGDRTCMLYQGTVVATGTATAIVVATGLSTELGRTTQENDSATAGTGGVEARMSELTKRILPLSILAGAGLFGVDMWRGLPLGQTVSRAVGLAVAAVPEGLPFVATLAELAAARRLSRRGVLVRSPSTIEALGRVNALCFDKTGTLTQGRITLRQVSDGRTDGLIESSDPWQRRIVETAVVASPQQNGGRPLAHLTDRAVVDGAREADIEIDASTDVIAELAFEPSRGFHATWTNGPDGSSIHVKGAPEVVLDRCVRWRRQDGVVEFDTQSRAQVEEKVEHWAMQGYRLLAVATRTSDSAPGQEDPGTGLDDSDVDGLEFLGLLGLVDPVHPTAAAAVGRLQRSGIDVIMITGDHPSTAEAIAAELDMLGDKRVMHGAELDGLDDEQLCGELPKISVFARVSPSQKARIVRQLRATDRIVAMTGDGVNDVPAIKLAHVGIAIGSRATPAARESADLVVADDRIETLTDAIVEGRGMWASVRDALSILLGGNLGEIGFSLGAGILGGGAALNARQLLVVNMLTDVLPAIAIAVRPPPHATPERLLAEGPDASLGTALNHDIYARATATASAAGVAWMLVRPLATAGQARTAGLVALVSTQLAQTLAMRGRTPLVFAAGAASLLILAAIVQMPGLSQFFGSQPLLPHQWGIALGVAVTAAVIMAVWQSRTGTAGAAHLPAETGSPVPLAVVEG